MEQQTFSNPVIVMERGMKWHAVYIPGDIVESMALKANTRLLGTANGVPFNLAALSDGTGGYFLKLGKQIRQTAGCREGQTIQVSISIHPNPDELDIPEEFAAALEQDPEAQQIFDRFTKGYQRSIIHYVTSAKRVDTRIKRSLELCEKIRHRTLSGMSDT